MDYGHVRRPLKCGEHYSRVNPTRKTTW
jgi:hypothetical protein